jgi:hypothetical protein
MILAIRMEGQGHIFMTEKQEPQAYQQQPYDSSFKALLDDQPISMLSFLFGEEVENAQELKEALLKEGTKPSLRVDCAYMVRKRGQAAEYVGHVEFEVSPSREIEARLLEYFGLLYRKYRKPVISVLVSPFETKNLPTSPLVVEFEGKILLDLHYRVDALGQYEAYEVFNRRHVELYTLLPTMKGGDAELLLRAIEEMQKFYIGQRDRLANHLLWFNTFLGRTTTVTQRDKERIDKKMEDFDSLLDESPFVQKRKAEALTEGLQKALVAVIRGRFPDLTEFAQQHVVKITKPDVLEYLIEQVSISPDESIIRQLLRPTAA